MAPQGMLSSQRGSKEPPYTNCRNHWAAFNISLTSPFCSMLLFQRIRATLENHAGDCKLVLVTENENKLKTIMKEMLDKN